MSKYRGFSESPFSTSSSNRPVTVEDPLPDGWEMLIDPESQFPFFVDHLNHRTSWKDPRRSKSKTLQAFMDSALGGDNFFKSSLDSQNPFWQSRLDPWASSQPLGFNRSPMGSPSTQRRGQSNIRRSTSPKPAGRSTPTLDSQMNRMHAQDVARAFMEGSMPGQQQQVYSSSPRRNEGFTSPQHAPEQGRRVHIEEKLSYSHKPERDYSIEGERVYNIPIRVEGRDYLNRPSNSRSGVLNKEPVQSREDYSRSPQPSMPPQGMPPQGMPPQGMPPQGMPPQGMPKSVPGNNHDHYPQGHSRQEYQQDQPQFQSETRQETQVTPPTSAQRQSSKGNGNQERKGSQEKQSQESPSKKPTTEIKKTDALKETGGSKQPTDTPTEEESKPVEEPPPQVIRIRNILKKILAICQDVEDFRGRRGTKDYLRIEEMLMRQMIELDNIDTMGDDRIRGERRMAVVTAQTLLSRLEKKALPADF